MSKKEFARNEGIPFSLFRGFLKNKDQLLQDMGRSDSISRKRKLEGRHGELQEAVYLWVVEKNSQGALPSNALIHTNLLISIAKKNCENCVYPHVCHSRDSPPRPVSRRLMRRGWGSYKMLNVIRQQLGTLINTGPCNAPPPVTHP